MKSSGIGNSRPFPSCLAHNHACDSFIRVLNFPPRCFTTNLECLIICNCCPGKGKSNWRIPITISASCELFVTNRFSFGAVLEE